MGTTWVNGCGLVTTIRIPFIVFPLRELSAVGRVFVDRRTTTMTLIYQSKVVCYFTGARSRLSWSGHATNEDTTYCMSNRSLRHRSPRRDRTVLMKQRVFLVCVIQDNSQPRRQFFETKVYVASVHTMKCRVCLIRVSNI